MRNSGKMSIPELSVPLLYTKLFYMTLYRVFILPLFTKLFFHNFASKMKKTELGVFFVLNLGVHDDKNVGGDKK